MLTSEARSVLTCAVFGRVQPLPNPASRFHPEGEVSHLFGGPGCPQEHRLGEVVAHELDADGEPSREASWDAYGRDAGEVSGDGAYIAGVHGEGVIHLLPDPERHRGCCRREQDVVAGEGCAEVLDYPRPNLLRLGVVGVVVARRQGVGAEHDPSLRLVSEAVLARLTIHLVYAVFRDPQAVAHAVEAGKVG